MDEVNRWLVDASIQEIHELVHCISTHPHSVIYQRARTTLEVKISDRSESSSLRLERQTKQLIILTWALVVLTFGLLVFTYFLVKWERGANQIEHGLEATKGQVQPDRSTNGPPSAIARPSR